MCRKELDEYNEWIAVLPFKPKDPKDLINKSYVQLIKEAQESGLNNEPYLYIKPNCPKDIKKKILAKWETVYKETKHRHEQGLFSSRDYF